MEEEADAGWWPGDKELDAVSPSLSVHVNFISVETRRGVLRHIVGLEVVLHIGHSSCLEDSSGISLSKSSEILEDSREIVNPTSNDTRLQGRRLS